MRVPIKWLSDYVELETLGLDVDQSQLKMKEFKLREVEHYFERAHRIEIGRISEIEQHPDADNLLVIQVDVNEEEAVQIVTSASNCTIGAYAPIVRKNGRIASGSKIKKGKMRGVESTGMLCSLEELGFIDAVVPKEYYDNIYILNSMDQSYSTGMPLDDALPEIKDSVLCIESEKKNISMIEVAIDIAESNDLELKKIVIEDQEIKCECNKESVIGYMAVKKNKTTPDWMKLRLMKSGIKPIGFLMDLKAYVEKEFGLSTMIDTLYDGDLKVTVAKDENTSEEMIELLLKRMASFTV